jgi:hypothetical protein
MLRRNKFEVHVWTVDKPDTARHFNALGVDSIITNRPQFVRQSLGAAATQSGVNTLTETERNDGWSLLFDGKSLSGWTGAKDAYTVEAGSIVCVAGTSGNLLAEREFSDFVLRFDFKLTEGANNGLGIRCPMLAKGNLHIDGIELQILDDSAEKYKTLKPYQFHGSVYGIQPAKRDRPVLKEVGSWNTQEVTVRGRTIKVILNGETIVDCNLDEATKNGAMDGVEHPGVSRSSGHIGFLGHGDRVEFRSIRVKDLSESKTAPGAPGRAER